MNVSVDYIGAAYEETLSAEVEVITTPQLLKMLGRDYRENKKFTTLQLEEEKFKALIDTGATRTFVGPLFVEIVEEHMINAGGMMKNGSKVELLGCIILKLKEYNEHCILPVRICSVLSYDVVLGMDFIAAAGVEFKGDNWRPAKKPPIRQGTRRSAPHILKIAQAEDDKMLKEDIMEPSQNPWCS
ncbi:hypothetical protein PV326_012732 [Microctonus aethiopoides]|nr:hypothetical protein PV326_012732 [Microctonus aethiopoides]